MELYNKEFVYFDWDDKLEGKKVMVSDDIYKLKRYVNGEEINTYEVSKSSDDKYPFRVSGTAFRFCYYDPYYEFRKAYLEGKQIQFKDSAGNWRDVEGEPIFTRDEYRIKPEWYIILDDYGLSRINSKKDGDILFEGAEEECIQWLEEHKKFENIMLAWKQGKIIQYNPGDGWEDCCDNKPAWDIDVKYRVEPNCKDDHKVAVEYVPFGTLEGLINAWDSKYPQNKNRPEGTMPLIWIKNKQKNRVYLITDFFFDKYYNNDVGTGDINLQLKELFEDYTFVDGSIIGKVKE